jgi:Holliday junction resolvase RusA-like endonuclease
MAGLFPDLPPIADRGAPTAIAEVCELTVWGVAQPQGNKTAFVRNGRAVLVEGRRKESREAFAGWRAAVATAARDWQELHHRPLLDGPLSVEATFYLPRPASAPKRVRYPATRPDIEKLVRGVLDSLNGLVIADDSRVVDLVARKRFAIETAPHATLRIASLGAG